jgi:phenylalanine-4-hydroxylase
VIDRSEELFDLLRETDFVALYDRFREQPTLTSFEILVEDVVVRKGSGDYWREFPATKTRLK